MNYYYSWNMKTIVLCTSVLYACAQETSFRHTEIKEDVCASYKESLRISKNDYDLLVKNYDLLGENYDLLVENYDLLAKDYNDLRKTYEEEVNNLDNISRRIRDLKLDKDMEKYILQGDK